MTTKYNLHSGLLLGIIIILTGCYSKDIKYENGAISPEKSISTFEVEPGFKIELVASEPFVADPVAMEIDEFGRMYVVEMHGYPLDKSGSGKIKLLEDVNGDGIMDKSTVFAENLVLPNGIQRWKKGVIVTDAPYVLYLEDLDNDGVSDIRDTILTGFSLSNPHINMNSPIYGLDNWIHLAHRGALITRAYGDLFNDEGNEIYFNHNPDGPRLPKNADSRSVRFRPDHFEIEMTSAKAQFGHTFDVWGRHLFGDNQNHAFAEIMAAPYLSRNPELTVSQATEGISDHGDAAEIYQITTHPERQMFSGAGTMTSASGIVAYAGGSFPEPFNKNVTFICESVSNLVHADKLTDNGTSFKASRIGRKNKEFLASTDAWSRPVNLYIGPDGALYMLDYYRRIIEHPEWMSEEAIKEGGLYDGMNMGRIYRISAIDADRVTWTKGTQLGHATDHALISSLNSSNIWHRRNAQRLLVDGNNQDLVPSIEALFDTSSYAEGRLHALWTLQGLGNLNVEMVKKALKDSEAGVRENAIKLAEMLLIENPTLIPHLLALKSDPAIKVRFQLLCTLGEIGTPEAQEISQELLFRDIEDKWIQVAALSSKNLIPSKLISKVIQRYKENDAYYLLTKRLASMLGANQRTNIDSLVQAISVSGPKKWQAPVLEGLADSYRYKKNSTNLATNTQALLIQNCFQHPDFKVRRASFNLIKAVGLTDGPLVEKAMKQATLNIKSKALDIQKRIEAVNVISLKNPFNYSEILQQLIVPQEHPSLQVAAIKTLSLIPDETIANFLLERWDLITPTIRDEALQTFMKSEKRKKRLLEAIKAGTIQASSVGWIKSMQLMQDNSDEIRNEARELFTVKDQEKIIKEFQNALDIKGSVESGSLVFEQKCNMCHQIRGENGTPFGPDLGTTQSWLSKDILANILEPGLSISVGFDTRNIQLNNEEVFQGIISSESSGAITVKIAPGVERTLNRSDIKSISILNHSLMPSFSNQLEHQEMADLIAYIQRHK